jgi:hypothetical protein
MARVITFTSTAVQDSKMFTIVNHATTGTITTTRGIMMTDTATTVTIMTTITATMKRMTETTTQVTNSQGVAALLVITVAFTIGTAATLAVVTCLTVNVEIASLI